jgi:CubicO group peptidase (beta-lactamase class C family)
LQDSVDRIAAETAFSGVVRVDRGDEIEFVKAYGFAHRGWEIRNEVDTRFGIASGTKGLTALTVMSLIEEGRLSQTTTARSVLGDDLPLIDDAVTVEHLLAHRSGIGDYVDEDIVRDPLDYVSPVPVHELGSTEEYLRALGGFETKFPPDERFSYSNGGYLVLALIAERASGTPFHELVVPRVCEPAGMVDTAFLRSDELPGRAALGYLAEDGPRTNVFHLPVRGSGDGGIYSTAADVSALWTALFAGRIVRKTWSPRWCDPGARCRRRRNRRDTALGSGSTPPTTWWSCTDRTRVCPSRPSTTRARASPTRSCRTRPRARGRSSCTSTSSSRGDPKRRRDPAVGSVTAVEREVPRITAR